MLHCVAVCCSVLQCVAVCLESSFLRKAVRCEGGGLVSVQQMFESVMFISTLCEEGKVAYVTNLLSS